MNIKQIQISLGKIHTYDEPSTGLTQQALGWIDLVHSIALYGVKTRVCSMKTVFYKVTLQEKFDSMYFKCYHEYCFSIVSGEPGM